MQRSAWFGWSSVWSPIIGIQGEFLIVTRWWGAALWLSAWEPRSVINLYVAPIAVRPKAGWDSDQVIFNALPLLLSEYPISMEGKKVNPQIKPSRKDKGKNYWPEHSNVFPSDMFLYLGRSWGYWWKTPDTLKTADSEIIEFEKGFGACPLK